MQRWEQQTGVGWTDRERRSEGVIGKDGERDEMRMTDSSTDANRPEKKKEDLAH